MTEWLRLRHVAETVTSNVDKRKSDDEIPVRLINYTDVYYGDRLTPDLPLMWATASASEIARHGVAAGDVLITKDSETADDIGVAAFVESSADDLVCGYHLSRIRAHQATVEPRYLFWALTGSHARDQMNVAATGVTRFGLRADSIRDLSIRVPPLSEQTAIADYLDTETNRIDALITKKRRMIELLEERLAKRIDALIWKSEGRSTPLMRLVPPSRKIMYGIILPGPDVDDGVLLVKGGDVKPGRLDPSRLSQTARAIESSYVRSRLRPGDLVFAIRGGVGDVEIVPPELAGANITQDVARISPDIGVDVRWLLYALRSPTAQRAVERRITGATIRGINIWELQRVKIPVPDFESQRSKATALKDLDRRHSATVANLDEQVSLLAERRQALITAAVTGELAVPGMAGCRRNVQV